MSDILLENITLQHGELKSGHFYSVALAATLYYPISGVTTLSIVKELHKASGQSYTPLENTYELHSGSDLYLDQILFKQDLSGQVRLTLEVIKVEKLESIENAFLDLAEAIGGVAIGAVTGGIGDALIAGVASTAGHSVLGMIPKKTKDRVTSLGRGLVAMDAGALPVEPISVNLYFPEDVIKSGTNVLNVMRGQSLENSTTLAKNTLNGTVTVSVK